MDYLVKGETMKKWMNRSVVLFAALFVTPAVFAQTALDKFPMYNNHVGSKQAQLKLNNEVLTILQSNKSAAVKAKEVDDLLGGVELCPKEGSKVAKSKFPKRCQRKEFLPKFKSFVYPVKQETPRVYVQEVSEQNSADIFNEQTDLNVVVPEKALYYGFSEYYKRSTRKIL